MIFAAMGVVCMVNEAAIGWRSVSTRGGPPKKQQEQVTMDTSGPIRLA